MIQEEIQLSPVAAGMRVEDLRQGEKPVKVDSRARELSTNGLYHMVETTLTFTNLNSRNLGGELEFPIPRDATVCDYALEIDGEMVSGVIVGKESARVAFENEMRKGADPGIVEQVKGNIWRTCIYPLVPNVPRQARVVYIEPLREGDVDCVVERDGDDVFVGGRHAVATEQESIASRLAGIDRGWILWDASASRRGKTDGDRGLLQELPEKGEWMVVIFRNVPEEPVKVTSREELLELVDRAACDGGTDLTSLLAALPDDGLPRVLFSDEVDTLSLRGPDMDAQANLVFASRPPAPARTVSVRRLAQGEEPPSRPVSGRLLATAWAANRIADLASQADSRKEEFLDLGRRYGVVSPVTSLIVLETLDQWLEYKIEPPADSRFHAEWIRRRAAMDDGIDAKEVAAAHERALLALWKERVQWWNDPKPRRRTPSSGLFEAEVPIGGMMSRRRTVPRSARMMMRRPDFAFREASEPVMAEMCCASVEEGERNGAVSSAEPPRQPVAKVVLREWNPDMPYLTALEKSGKGNAYAEYLRQREEHGASPAFYLDCAGWFFKRNRRELGLRIISNLAELKLEDPALWRTMGWRLREAGEYDEAVRVFRHVRNLRGEEGQSHRDLALVLSERGRGQMSRSDVEEAMALFAAAAFQAWGRRAARRSNDMQVSIVALEELNGLIAWSERQTWSEGRPVVPAFDTAFRRDLPVALRIVLSWDADETDVDLHVLEPSGEEAYYGNRRTDSGGFVSEDVVTGYGPEEYLAKNAEKGVYKVLAHYFASHQQRLTGATTVTATVYTDWGTSRETRRILTLRLDKPRDKHFVGDVQIG